MLFLIKALNFFRKNRLVSTELEYGNLYKIKNEPLPFRYIYRRGDKEKKIHRFKHHSLKEYVFYNTEEVERPANRKERRLYNIIKNHIDNVAKEIKR